MGDVIDRSGGFHVYSTGYAFKFEPDITRNGEHTIAIDAAPMVSGGADWKNRKTRVQVAMQELPALGAFLFGYQLRFAVDFHGGVKKGLELKRQDRDGYPYAVRVWSGSAVSAAGLTRSDFFMAQALVVQAIRRNWRAVDGAGLMRMLEMYSDCANRTDIDG